MNPGPRRFRAALPRGVGRGVAGIALGGLALAEEMGSVTVVPPGWRLEVGAVGEIHLRRERAEEVTAAPPRTLRSHAVTRTLRLHSPFRARMVCQCLTWRLPWRRTYT